MNMHDLRDFSIYFVYKAKKGGLLFAVKTHASHTSGLNLK